MNLTIISCKQRPILSFTIRIFESLHFIQPLGSELLLFRSRCLPWDRNAELKRLLIQLNVDLKWINVLWGCRRYLAWVGLDFLKWFAQNVKSQRTRTSGSHRRTLHHSSQYTPIPWFWGIPSRVCFLSLLYCSLDNLNHKSTIFFLSCFLF